MLFISDPIRRAVLLLGGDKTGRWSKWYESAIPKAEQIYAEYLSSAQYRREAREYRQQVADMTEQRYKHFSELAASIDVDEGRRQEAAAARQRAMAEILTYHLAEIRRTRNITQSEVARLLGVGQPRVSRIERGESLHLDTLRAYVRALGGRLEVAAVFDDDERVIIDIGEKLRPTG